MCCLPLLAALDQLRLGDCKICTWGDWEQLPPHPDSNSWRGCHVSPCAFQQSRLYKSWSDCTCFKLTRCRRSDQNHFDFYTGLSHDLKKAISQSRKDTETQMMQICIHAFHTKDAGPSIPTSKQEYHTVSNALKSQEEMTHLSNVSLGLSSWVVQQPANLSMVADIL